jgi:hypothetical protein
MSFFSDIFSMLLEYMFMFLVQKFQIFLVLFAIFGVGAPQFVLNKGGGPRVSLAPR